MAGGGGGGSIMMSPHERSAARVNEWTESPDTRSEVSTPTTTRYPFGQQAMPINVLAAASEGGLPITLPYLPEVIGKCSSLFLSFSSLSLSISLLADVSSVHMS